ncbi:hypothetical protein MAFF211271_36500 (plasmid) [Ralstonia syzygii subsp. indonesiensis]|nr:hypothetical protein MAFF211271_36500 [Ralstonia pseudosolanacearum]
MRVCFLKYGRGASKGGNGENNENQGREGGRVVSEFEGAECRSEATGEMSMLFGKKERFAVEFELDNDHGGGMVVWPLLLLDRW